MCLVIESVVSIQLNIQLNWLSASCQSASCQIVLSASWFLPCWFSPGVGLLSWYPVGIISRRPKPVARLIVIAIYTVVVGDDCWIATMCRDSVSRILDGRRWYEIWRRLLFTSLVIYVSVVDTFPDSKSVRSCCQVCRYASLLVKSFSPIYEIKWSSNITIKK